MAKPPFPIAALLLLAVLLRGGWALLPVLLPVAGIRGAPLARTVLANLAVFRIGGNLLFVIILAPLPLAIGLATNRLPRLKLRGSETLLTIPATRFSHTAVVANR